jgi:hypothetical protein
MFHKGTNVVTMVRLGHGLGGPEFEPRLGNDFFRVIYSAFEKSLCTYNGCWK